MRFKYRWWGKGDLDASIGIFFDGFSKILSATGIMLLVFGMPADIVLGKIVPGIGLAIFVGNLWYFYEAWALARQEKRQDVTAQPFGIGASQLTGWLYLIMGPVYWQTGDAELAFQVGLAASLIGGMIEVLGGFIGRWIVKVVPHSALMGNMASSALVWLSFVGIAMVFDKPIYALLPFCMVFIDYLGKADRRFQKIPTGVIAVVLGAVIAWATGSLTWENFTASFSDLGFYPPTFCGGDILKGLKGIFPFLPVIVGCVFVFIIDNDWLKAAITNVVALGLTGIGMIHSKGLLFTDTYAPDLGFVAAYCVLIAAFLVMHFLKFNQKAHQADLEAEKAAALEAAKQES